MRMSRRDLLGSTLAAGAAVALPLQGFSEPCSATAFNPNYAKLDEVLKQPVFKRELFNTPVIIETLELLRYKDSFLCRVRSKDGAEGISIGNALQLDSVYPILVNRMQPFFIGKDARDLEKLLEQVYVYDSNYKLQSPALWVPLATIEFAILDMMGRISGKSIGQLIGEIHNKQIAVYQANSERDISAEETIDHLHKQLEASKAKAIKFKVGGQWPPEYPAGRSEKAHPPGSQNLWRQDGNFGGLEWLLYCRRSDSDRQVDAGV